MANRVVTRVGLAAASSLLGVALIANLRAPEDVALDTASKVGAAPTSTSGSAKSSSSGAAASAAPVPSSATVAPSGSSSSSGSTSAAGTYVGTEVLTRYGPVEVQITVAGGKVTAIAALELPSGGRSGMISSYAEPVLHSEALSAQSAQIDVVSGATYTSDAYERSLQAALDKAGL
jgi:uncharacterized protein with FMN-binding domain